MAELEIDQSNLPRVHEVCQTFAVLEDGALAHNLQEQEIEQYYSTNVQKNQLVQNDIRLAKRMQDEEEEQQAQQSALLRQASRQIEEQDLEYARVVQEELQRGAEEVRRREQHDAEIAKRLQEEEEQWMRRSSRGHDSHVEGSAAEPERLPTHLEEQCSSTTIRGHCFTSHRSSEFHEPPSPRRVCSRNNRTSWSNQGQTGPVRQMTDEFREASGEESEDSDTVFNQQLSLWSKRMYEELSNAPPRWRASVYQPHVKNNRTIFSHSNFTDSFDYLEEETEDWDEDYRKSKYQDRERRHKREDDYHRSRNEEADDGLAGVGERRRSRSESVRMHDRSEHRSKVLARTWSHKDNPDKRVSFQDDDRSSYREQRKNSQVWEMLGHILRERGVPVKIGGSGAPLQIRPQSRDSQVLHGSEVSYGDFQPHQRAFQRSATVRHSFHGDIRERRRLSYRENSSRDHREAPDRCNENGEVSKICRGDSFISNIQRRSSRRRKELKHTNGDKHGEGMPDNCRVRRATSERGHRITEERFSSDEEEEGEQEVERRVGRPRRRALLRSQSLRISKASTRHRSRPMAGGASLEPEPRKASLDLGELHQVLKDEELARKLQREEEKLLSRNSRPSSGNTYPDGDFRVAQVAQDEEIARYMQKQEIKSKRRSRELEGPGSWREHRLMISHHDRQATRGRQVQRERLDSEGLPSPTEDCSPEDLPPSPIATTPKDTQIRNVAEELDPTFQARSHSVGSGVGQSGPVGGSPLGSPSSFHNFLEEPTFIPPTKRQAEKSDVKKQKPKKETCKQQ